ncbi:unnamed protein product, partial [Lampetra fluviatilis]
PRPLNSVRREHVNPQEIGGAKETTASASRIASDRGDGLDNPAGPCGLAGRERRLPPAVPTLAPDPPPVRYEPRRATEATAARRAGERRKLSQHSKSSRPPRSSANDGCASLLLTCLFCRCREPCLTLPLRCCLVALLAPLCRACGRAGACCPCDPHRLCRPPADAAAATPPQSPPTSPPRRGVHTARGSLIDEVHVRPKFDFAPCEECCEVVEVVELCIECSNLCFRAYDPNNPARLKVAVEFKNQNTAELPPSHPRSQRQQRTLLPGYAFLNPPTHPLCPLPLADCCVRSVLACLYCEFASLCWTLLSCVCCCRHCCSCAEESGAGDAQRCLGDDSCPGAELGGRCCCCGCCCVYCCCCCGPEVGEDVPPCGLCGDVDGGMLQGCCESSDCVEICFECCGFCLLS